jgi:RHS repeat-associated protein
MLNRRVAAAIAVIALPLLSLFPPLSPVSPGFAKETGEDRPVGTLGGVVHADPFTGVATTSIPIEVPPGRNGMQPTLALTYNSANGNGWLGMGWELAQEGIYRQTKWGVDYTNNDGPKAFVVKMAGVSGELVPTPPPAPSNQWSAKIERGFSRIEKLAASDGQIMWKVTTKQGRKHYFGQTAASRQVDPANASRIFGWLLDRVEDPDGNYMAYSYWTDAANNQVYLDRIEYSGNGSNLPTHQVKFFSENRLDVSELYNSNFKTKLIKRAKSIEVRGNGNIMAVYKFAYAQRAATSISLLNSIQRYGNDALTDSAGNITNEAVATKLPPIITTYSQESGTLANPVYSDDTGGNWSAYSFASGDFNGDGKTDIMMYYHLGGWQIFVRLALGDGRFGPSQYYYDGTGNWSSYYPAFGDFNGDGRTDMLLSHTGGIWQSFVRLANVDGSFGPAIYSDDTGGNWSPYSFASGDFNGDGKTDIMMYHKQGATWQTSVRLALGNGKFGLATYSDSVAGDWSSYSYASGDFNGDGKTDIMLYYHQGGWQANIRLANSDGTFGQHISSQISDGNWTSYYPGFGDFDGDGTTDMLMSHTAGIWQSSVRRSNSRSANLLNAISSGLGSATTITYAPSTQWSNMQLPFPVQRVSAISVCGNWNSTTSICNTAPSTTNYSYSGGFYHIGERDLRGVAQVTVTRPADATGQRTITETYFHQGSKAAPVGETLAELQADTKAYTKGQPYKVVVKDQTGTIHSETVTEYYDDALDGTTQTAPFFTPVKEVVTKLYTGGVVSKETKVAYAYGESPQYGNITREDHYGDATNNNAITGDDKTIVRTYGHNTTDYLIGYPTSEIVYAGIGTTNRVAQTDFYYDGTTSCSTASTNLIPTKGHLTRTVRHFFNGTSTHGNPEMRLAYDTSGNRICTRDARGNITTITYDSTGTFALSTTTPSPASLTTTTAYYGVNGVPMDTGLYGQVKSVTDPNGRITSHEYDALGRKTKTTNPDGFFVTTTYNYGNGQTVGTQHVLTTNSLGHSSAAYFDGLGRSIRKTSTYTGGPTRETKTEYDVRGQVLRTSLPYFTGGTVYWRTPSYDALGRIIQLTNPDTTVSRSCYADWTTVTVEADGDRKRETKDAFGRVVKIEEDYATVSTCDTAVGTPYATTTYQYDVLGNLTQVTDAKGNVSTMAYDSLNRKISMHDPDMGDWSYQYDENGNLTKQTDAKGQVLWFQYDELNRRRQKDYTTQKALGSGDVKYIYDDTGTTTNRKGRLKQVQDAATDVTFEYDVMGRIDKSTKVLDGTSYITTSLYDGLGRLMSVSYPSTPVKSVDYLYVGPYLEQVKDKPGDGTVTYVQYAGWNEMGQPATATYNVGTNQVVTTYTYQTADNATCLNKHTFRPCTTKTQKGTNPAYLDLRYVFTNGGNIHDIFDQLNAANSQSFDYDALDRLTLANGPYGTGGVNSTLIYSYDEIGNLTANTQVGTYGYPTSGPASVRPHAVTTAGANTYTYDTNGNLTSGAGRTFTWNFENKPLTITQGGQTTTFVYDGDGGRVKKIVGTTTTRYISKLYECDNTNCTRFIYAGSARIATIASNGAIHFWHPDHLGSSTVITDSTGAKVQALTYYPYGATRTNQSFTTPAVDVPYKYTGKELDSSTGLYYYDARYYDPQLGRFISADTVVAHTRDPQDLNRYAYARNSPLAYTDPTGHFFKKVFKAIGKAFESPLVRAISWAVAPGYAMYADPATRGPAVIGSAAVVGFVIGGPVGSQLAGKSVAGLAFWGAVGGAVSGGIAGAYQEGDIEGALKGAFSGAMFGAIGGAYGNSWDWSRVALNSAAGGISSHIKGNGFARGFATSLAVSGLSFAAIEMRTAMIEQSSINLRNATGNSVGFFGDGFKLGGGRWIEGAFFTEPSVLGGLQGGLGSFAGMAYAPGSWQDYLVEAYAGPHDFLNSGYWYNASGNAVYYEGIASVFGETLNYTNVLIATPFVGASVTPNMAYQYFAK